jgi:hypothetical protein
MKLQINLSTQINAVRHDGVVGPAHMDSVGWEVRLSAHLSLPLASEVGFCHSRYRRWDKRFCGVCMLCW